MNHILSVILLIAGALIGLLVGYLSRKNFAEKKIGSAEEYSLKIIEDANKEADTRKKEILVEAKDEVFRLRTELEDETKRRRAEMQTLESRLNKKEETLEKRSGSLDQKSSKIDKELKKIDELKAKAKRLVTDRESELEKVAGMTADEAADVLIESVKEHTIRRQAVILKEMEARTRDEASKTAREIIATCIQRYASEQVAESTVSVVNLPNDEMKGRIIGREGRNIRAFETLTGVDLIIDDTPEAVVVSAFDPIRREVARLSLERLITDGRIHPTRIEEIVEKTQKEVDETIREKGEEACNEVNIHGINPEIIKLLGKLNYRTSYGQNVLRHAVEVSSFAGMLAAEIGANVKLAKRGGLLHDLGKALDHEMEGPHVALGVQAAKRYKEKPEVINCIEAHHGDVEPTSVEAVLVQAADAISAARPGARRESMENYIQRLENLEAIANSFEGIESSYAIQAGRELRIMVKPDQVDEDRMLVLANEVATKIENELEYPGQIKVNIIRENRASQYAK